MTKKLGVPNCRSARSAVTGRLFPVILSMLLSACATAPPDDKVDYVVLSDDGRYMASAGDDKTVVIWDMETLKHIGRTDTKGQDESYESTREKEEGERDVPI